MLGDAKLELINSSTQTQTFYLKKPTVILNAPMCTRSKEVLAVGHYQIEEFNPKELQVTPTDY